MPKLCVCHSASSTDLSAKRSSSEETSAADRTRRRRHLSCGATDSGHRSSLEEADSDDDVVRGCWREYTTKSLRCPSATSRHSVASNHAGHTLLEMRDRQTYIDQGGDVEEDLADSFMMTSSDQTGIVVCLTYIIILSPFDLGKTRSTQFRKR